MKKLLTNPSVLLLSLGISLTISLCGNFLFPIFFDAGTKTPNPPDPLIGSLIVLAAFFAVTFLFALLFETIKKHMNTERQAKPLGKAFGGILVLTGMFLVAFFFISLLYGLLAVLLNVILKPAMTFDQIKGVINIATMILTVAIMPLFLNILFTYGLGKMKLIKSISTGFKTIRNQYVKLLVFLAVVVAAGWLGNLPFQYLDETLLLRSVKAAVTAIVGMCGLTFLFALFDENKPIARKRKPQEVPKTEAATDAAEKEAAMV